MLPDAFVWGRLGGGGGGGAICFWFPLLLCCLTSGAIIAATSKQSADKCTRALGGGEDARFDGQEGAHRNRCLNSSCPKLPGIVKEAGVRRGPSRIVDYCHRARSAEMRKFCGTAATFSLGASRLRRSATNDRTVKRKFGEWVAR